MWDRQALRGLNTVKWFNCQQTGSQGAEQSNGLTVNRQALEGLNTVKWFNCQQTGSQGSEYSQKI